MSHYHSQRRYIVTKVAKQSEQNPHFSDKDIKRLAQYMDVLIEIDMKQKALYRRLKKGSTGFAMQGEGRNCSLCGRSVHETDGWYDKCL